MHPTTKRKTVCDIDVRNMCRLRDKSVCARMKRLIPMAKAAKGKNPRLTPDGITQGPGQLQGDPMVQGTLVAYDVTHL